jgi:hypothetical protein
MEDLERDLAAETGVPRPVHLAHAAHAEEGDDLVRAEAATGGERDGGLRSWMVEGMLPDSEYRAGGEAVIAVGILSDRLDPLGLEPEGQQEHALLDVRLFGIRQEIQTAPENE